MEDTRKGKSGGILPPFVNREQPRIPASLELQSLCRHVCSSAACMGHMVRCISWNFGARPLIYVAQTFTAQRFPKFRAMFSKAPPVGYLWIESHQWRQLLKVKTWPWSSI